MMLWVEIGAALLVLFCGSLLFAIALGRAAKCADEAVESLPELAEIALTLTQLSDVRSPSGRYFFPTLEARRELAEIVHEALVA
jgi:hypothetical protein